MWDNTVAMLNNEQIIFPAELRLEVRGGNVKFIPLYPHPQSLASDQRCVEILQKVLEDWLAEHKANKETKQIKGVINV